MNQIILLGPQRPQPNVAAALEMLAVSGSVAVVTAGWQDTEAPSAAELQTAIGRPSVSLELYARAERLFEEHPGLREAYRQRQDRLQDLQRAYRVRLRNAVKAVRELAELRIEARLLAAATRSAIAQIRTLDRHHLRRIERVHRDFERGLPDPIAAALATEHRAIAALVAASSAVLVAGGHVAVLLNRMRLLGLERLLPARPLIAWSAGAMAISERVIVFHDHAPQGRRPAEVFDAGFGVLTGTVPLPDAALRLDWSDRPRLGLLARRFSPARCVTLDNGALLRFDAGELVHAEDSMRLDRSGRKRALRAA